MNFNNQKIIVVGLAKSGVSVIKVLNSLGARVTVTDMKTEQQLEDILCEIKPYIDLHYLGNHPVNLSEYELAVISPGVPLYAPFVKQIVSAGIPLIGEIELAYLLCKGNFLGITGTNGKTTTTALIGAIFEMAQRPNFVVGNIGVPAVSKALEATEDTTMITELSSFQLETIRTFRAKIAIIMNLTPDHLDRHGDMEGYKAAKARIFENQLENDDLILNYDDILVRDLAQSAKGNVHYFSQKEVNKQSAYLKDGAIWTRVGGLESMVCMVDEMKIFGRHNVENALAATLACQLAGISPEVIGKALVAFKGVEHRIEFVDEIHGRKFYNDSKGTNPDSTVCAIQSMVQPTHLIAGGYDKKIDLSPIFDVFENKIKQLYLMGATAPQLVDIANSRQFNHYELVEDMETAVNQAYANSEPGDVILLSPACASWGMYDNFEQRGHHFKSCVAQLKSKMTER